ncbi:MAG: CBS domain-containing protein [Caldilineaceae bacterium]
MLVRDRMSSPAVTVTAETPFQDALSLMRDRKFRRLPVVNEHGRLVGIVSERDLLHAAPSPATSLSVWEVNYLLWKLKIADVMTEDVVTVSPETPIEDAAQLMISRKIGGLPVVDAHGGLMGLITETDIFSAFTELLGGGEHGLRVQVRVPEGKGVLAKLADAIYRMGGNIISVGTFHDRSAASRMLLVKVSGVERNALESGIKAIGDEVVDARVV